MFNFSELFLPSCLRKELPISGLHVRAVCFPGPKSLTFPVGGLLIVKAECGQHRGLRLLHITPVLACFLHFTLSEL